MTALTRNDTESTEAQKAADFGTNIDAWMVALVKLEGMLYDQTNKLLYSGLFKAVNKSKGVEDCHHTAPC